MTKFGEHWQCTESFIETTPDLADRSDWRADWLNSVAKADALRPAPGGFDFGDASGEALAALEGEALFPLAQAGSIQVWGRDAEVFLQGQLSNDVAALRSGSAQLSSYNSPKGRVLAVFVGTRHQANLQLETRAELVPALLKRLRMFVLRAQVQLTDASASHPMLGLAGQGAIAALARLGLPTPTADWSVATEETVTVMRRPGPGVRYSVQAPAPHLAGLWTQLAADARPCGTAAWRLLDILGGLPSVIPATQDHFVAQMLNLDTLGGISFSKGCYTGQEVVARLHYLGKLKRRMFLAFNAHEAAAGTSIHLAEGDDPQAVGEVVDCALHPQHGAALLMVLQSHHAASALCLQSMQGATLQVQPVAVPEASLIS